MGHNLNSIIKDNFCKPLDVFSFKVYHIHNFEKLIKVYRWKNIPRRLINLLKIFFLV